MKTVIFTVCLFVLTVSAVITNSIYINKTSTLLCESVEDLPRAGSESCQNKVEDLAARWAKCKNVVELSTSLEHIDTINDHIASLSVYAKSGCEAEFERTRALIYNAFAELRRFENLNFFDIF